MGVFPNCEVMAQQMEQTKTELDIAYFIWKQKFLEYNQENNSITKQKKLERLRLKLYKAQFKWQQATYNHSLYCVNSV